MTPFVAALSLLASAPGDTLVVPIEEVVVTGTRVPESALKAPAAISVVDGRRFRDSRLISLKDALGGIPGLLVQSRGGAQDVRITMRGFGARGNGERSNVGNLRGIRILTDGVPVTEPDGRSSLDLVNLRTNFLFDAPYAELRERLGAFGFHREQVSTGLVMGRGRGVLTLLNSTFDGWRVHSASTVALGQARLMIPIDPGTQLRVLLDGTHTLNRFPGALTRARLEQEPRSADSDFVARDERHDHRVGRVALGLDHDFDRDRELALSLYLEPKVLQRSERNRFRDFHRYHLGGSATGTLRFHPRPGLETVTLVGGDQATRMARSCSTTWRRTAAAATRCGPTSGRRPTARACSCNRS